MSKRTHFTDIGLTGDVWNNVSVNMTAKQGQGLKQPTWTKIADNGAGSTGIYSWSFSASTEEELFFSVQAPFSYKEGTNVIPHLHWMPATTNVGAVVWGMELSVVNVGGAMTASQIITSTSSSTGTANELILDVWDALDGTLFEFNSTLVCRIFRDAANAADTFTGEAFLLLVDFNHLMDTVGADDIINKTPGNKG